MNNTNETQGLKIVSITPSHKQSGINVYSSIDTVFSSDINPITFTNNVVVLEDINRIYKNINDLKDYSKYKVVKGSISYKDKTLHFEPEQPFNVNTCYIVMLNDNITDITGNKLTKKHISCFFTEIEESIPPIEILSPSYGCISDKIPIFTWKNQCAKSYVFQVSKVNSFEVLLLNEVIPGNDVDELIKYTPNFYAEEGMYFIRIKNEKGEWSNVHQIFIKPVTDAVIAEQDVPEIKNLKDFIDDLVEPIEILEYFPTPNSTNNTLKTNIFYIKIKGEIDENRIDFGYSSVFGESIDEEHEEYGHGEVNGIWSLVYDSYFNVTYVIFTPEDIDDTVEYIETYKNSDHINYIGRNK